MNRARKQFITALVGSFLLGTMFGWAICQRAHAQDWRELGANQDPRYSLRSDQYQAWQFGDPYIGGAEVRHPPPSYTGPERYWILEYQARGCYVPMCREPLHEAETAEDILYRTRRLLRSDQ